MFGLLFGFCVGVRVGIRVDWRFGGPIWSRARHCVAALGVVLQGVGVYQMGRVVQAVVLRVVRVVVPLVGVICVRGSGVVRAFDLRVGRVVAPRDVPFSYSGNGSIWSRDDHARCCNFFGLVDLAD